MTAEEFKKKFIIKFKMDTKAVIAYISKLEKENKTLKEERDATNRTDKGRT